MANTSSIRKAGAQLLDSCRVASSFVDRFFGLMGKDPVAPLFFPKCNSIHTFFMRVPIDVVYLDQDYYVVAVDRAMKPWRLGKPRWKAKHVLELAAGHASTLGITVGDRLEVTA